MNKFFFGGRRRKGSFWKKGTLGKGRIQRERVLQYQKEWEFLRRTSVAWWYFPGSETDAGLPKISPVLPAWLPGTKLRCQDLGLCWWSSDSHLSWVSLALPARLLQPDVYSAPPLFLGEGKIKHQRKNYIKEKDISLPVLSVWRSLILLVTSFPFLEGVTLPLLCSLNIEASLFQGPHSSRSLLLPFGGSQLQPCTKKMAWWAF